MIDMDKISCRMCGSDIFNIGVVNFGRMYIECIECGDMFVIGPGLTVASILSLLRTPKEYNIRKEDILYRIARQEYPICADGFQYMEPIKNIDGKLEKIRIMFEDEKNIELIYVEYRAIIDDYIRSLNIKEWECGDCGFILLDYAKEVIDEDAGSACPICGSGMSICENIIRG